MRRLGIALFAGMFALCMPAHGLDLWCWTPYTPVPEETPADTEDRAKVYAARGEREGVVLVVDAGRKGADRLRVVPEPVSDAIDAPEVWFAGQADQEIELAPADGLVPAATPSIARRGRALFWLDYAIPRGAEPGVYRHRIGVERENGRGERIEIRVEVFPFELPERYPVPYLAPLDRSALRRVYDLDANAPDAWRPYYEDIVQAGIDPAIWDGGGLVRQGRPARLLEHADVLAGLAPSMPLAVGPALFPDAGLIFGVERGPAVLERFATAITAWHLDRQDSAPLLFGPITPSDRTHWAATRATLRALREHDSTFPVLLAAPPHPDFQGLVDQWAIPLRAWSPDVLARTAAGAPLASGIRVDASIRASTSGRFEVWGAYETTPEDAIDGSAQSIWTPHSRDIGPWIELELPGLHSYSGLALIWPNGSQRLSPDVWTTGSNGPLSTATTSWEHSDPPTPFASGVSRGTYRFPQWIRRLRLDFSGSDPRAVRLAEIVLYKSEGAGVRADTLEPGAFETAALWLDIRHGAYPRIDSNALLAEVRAIGWTAWRHGMAGVFGPALNAWPATWQAPLPKGARLPSIPEEGSFLVYPFETRLTPSARAHALRDGLEDVAYVAALRSLADDDVALPEELLPWYTRGPVDPTPEPEAVANYLASVFELRLAAGRALPAHAKDDDANDHTAP